MELVQVKGNTWYLAGEGLIPLYRLDEERCILLDSGTEWERKALKQALEREKLLPVGVLGSHDHVDHVGSHQWLKRTYGAKICMSEAEAVMLNSSMVHRMIFERISYGTMEAFEREIRVEVDQVLGKEDGVQEFLGVPFRIHHTPGHSMDHVCIGTPDGVCYVGDLLISKDLLEYAQLPYHLIHRGARESMEKMRRVEGYSHYLMAHRGVSEELSETVDANLARTDWVCDQLLGVIESPLTWSEVMAQVVERNRLFTDNERKHHYYEHCVQHLMDYLIDTGRAAARMERGIRRFVRV